MGVMHDEFDFDFKIDPEQEQIRAAEREILDRVFEDLKVSDKQHLRKHILRIEHLKDQLDSASEDGDIDLTLKLMNEAMRLINKVASEYE
jgi:hypothetical protein